jgi:hypothetical protein
MNMNRKDEVKAKHELESPLGSQQRPYYSAILKRK